MSINSSFLQSINTPKAKKKIYQNCNSKPTQEHKTASCTERNSSSDFFTPTRNQIPHLRFPTEASRLSRSSTGRSSQRLTSTHLKLNALAHAIKNNDLNSLKRLLKCGMSAKETDCANVPVLLLTLEHSGKPEFLKALLDAGADPNARHPLTHRTGLHLAAKYGFQSIARQLLSARANVNLLDSKGDTPLMYAVRAGHAFMLRLLIQHCASVDVRNSNNETALYFAVENKSANLVDVLLLNSIDIWNYPNNNGITPLLLACKLNVCDIAELILIQLEDFSTIDCKEKENGKTALHWAVWHKAINLMEQLLQIGADPNVKDINLETPFLMAVKLGLQASTIEIFFAYDSDVFVSDLSNSTALHYAASHSDFTLVSRLVEEGADPNARCAKGMTALMGAVFKNHPMTTDVLLSMGAEPNIFDLNHVTPLAFSILGSNTQSEFNNNNTGTVVNLIRKGADVDEPANIFNIVKKHHIRLACDLSSIAEVRGYSPLEIAYLKGNSSVFEILIQAGCNLNSFMVEYLELNELYEIDSLKFETMIEIWKNKKRQPRFLSELCRKPYFKLINDYQLSNRSEHSEIIKEIIGKIQKPIICTRMSKINHNYLYNSCRKKNYSNIKPPTKIHHSLLFVKDKTPINKSLQYNCYDSTNQREQIAPQNTSPNNATLMRNKLNRFPSMKEEVVNTIHKMNIFDRLYFSVRPRTKDAHRRSNKEHPLKIKEPKGVVTDRHSKDFSKPIISDKPHKKLILVQNFLIR